ncbi:DNA-binding response regulator, OmpR family, contains REC and winged-helix (wHTH) domain [Clostridium collagenovorans DSM 3089]|uniref:Stage 0 sporulation protein A homolog n=1 Tax=Clostridium collagenovorans DSM 3089 TaxID=1121306 RepID=A0A1M5VGB4_9CLOT|nr:response regulator transcription factor [Clostridium collagenovorans]SHH73973.1 DNA-binding response regulator, OmpR family, contains REC and winged-helix (wHTH) domain [Clostridium collagenovorans DSM 3089]
MKSNLLIIEDDKDIAEMVKEYLEKEGYKVFIANRGEEGIRLFNREKVNLIMLDVMMEGMDGYETLEKIRVISEVPVIMLTAKGHQMDKVIGFKRGCDDYITKPFDLVELSLRIAAILRRGKSKNSSDSSLIQYKDLIINKDEYSVTKCGEDINLTKKEFDILVLLMSNQGRVYTSQLIYEQVWNEAYLENDNSVITHIRNLREKLGDKVKESFYIKTIWGVGYKVEKDV